jgi:hypothetical protein
MVYRGDDEARIGQRLGRVVMADEIAAPAVREDDKRSLVALDRAVA